MGVCRESIRRSMLRAAALVLMAVPAFAQLDTVTILGSVKDPSGASIPGATVAVTNTDTGLTRTAMTEQDGSYRFPELPPGHYQVKAEATGFSTQIRTGFNIEVTQQPVINFTMQVGATTQQVTVTGETPQVDTQDSTLGGSVNEQQMAELPLNGRNYLSLTLLQPGVNQDRNQGASHGSISFSVNGATPRSNNFTLDGAILQNGFGRNPVAGTSGNALGLDGIKEFKMVTGTYQAEYGLAMGSEIVEVSKGGTNQFHGDAFEYFRNSALDANDFFANRAGVPIAPFQKNQFGGAFGGPIKKGKTFFYAVYEGIRQNLGVVSDNHVLAAGCHGTAGSVVWNGLGAQPAGTIGPCPDIGANPADPNQANPTLPYTLPISQYIAPFLAIIPVPNIPPSVTNGTLNLAQYVFNDHDLLTENYGQIRLDQNFSSSDTFFARYTIDNAVQDNTLGHYTYFRTLEPGRNQWITLAENHVFSPTVLNTARFSFSRTFSTTFSNNVGLPGGLGPQIVSGMPTGVVTMNAAANGTYTEFGSNGAAPETFYMQNVYTLSDDVNWTRGKHAFKFGTLLNRWNEGSQSTSSFHGQIQFRTPGDFLTSKPYIVEFAAPFSRENRFYIFNTAGFYGQDDWRATSKLTINLGLRYEFMTTPRELQGKQSRLINDYTDAFTLGPIMANNTKHDFSPRFGFAYDPFGNGKTAIRGGVGIYYDIGNLGEGLSQNSEAAPPFSALVDITSSSNSPIVGTTTPGTVTGWEGLLATTLPGYSQANGWPFPIPQQVIQNYMDPNNPAVLANLSPLYSGYNFKSPYMIQYNVSVQRQLPWNMAATVAYVGNHGVHLVAYREGNPIFPTSTMPCGDPASLCVQGAVPLWDPSAPNFHTVNPHIGSSTEVTTFADSKYNALQLDLQKQTSHGLEFDASFTHSQTYDDTQGQSPVADCSVSGALAGTYPLDPRGVDWGPSCFNIPNNFEFSMLYHFPSPKGRGFVSKALGGWFVGTIITIQGGLPFSPIVGQNRSQSGNLQNQQDRANINTPALLAAYPCNAVSNPCAYTPVPYNPNTVITGNIDQWYNPNMFSISPQFPAPAAEQASCPPGTAPCNFIGQLGTAGRNILSGPPLRDWDLSFVKDTKVGFLGEAGNIEFRAEFFNVLNHPNFGEPGATPFLGNTGDTTPFSEAPVSDAINSIQGTPRQIQFALKIEF
jgi:hypothetical protein